MKWLYAILKVIGELGITLTHQNSIACISKRVKQVVIVWNWSFYNPKNWNMLWSIVWAFNRWNTFDSFKLIRRANLAGRPMNWSVRRMNLTCCWIRRWKSKKRKVRGKVWIGENNELDVFISSIIHLFFCISSRNCCYQLNKYLSFRIM